MRSIGSVSPGCWVPPFATLLARIRMPWPEGRVISRYQLAVAGSSLLAGTRPPLGERGDYLGHLGLLALPASSRDHPSAHLLQKKWTGYEDKAPVHRLDQGARVWSLLPAELWSLLMFSTNRHRIHLSTVSVHKNLLIISHDKLAKAPLEEFLPKSRLCNLWQRDNSEYHENNL